MTVGILFGAALGSLTAAALQGAMLQRIIGIFAIVMAVQMAFYVLKASTGQPGKVGLSLAGAVIGWASAIFGIGGGSLSVPYLSWRGLPMVQQRRPRRPAACRSHWLGREFHRCRLADARPSRVESGFVDPPAVLGIATSMFFARLGARLAHRLSPRVLRLLFALLLLERRYPFRSRNHHAGDPQIDPVAVAIGPLQIHWNRYYPSPPRRNWPPARRALRPRMAEGQAFRPGVLGGDGGDRRWPPGADPRLLMTWPLTSISRA
ncbi:hypothetical protein SSTU70S_03681 [Stutzerimonas stutzeri]